jgi:Protein  of unknown function (DUF3018)
MEAVMGKHEVVKSSSSARVAKHRAAMKANGYRLKQIWVAVLDDPAIRAEIARANHSVANFEAKHPEDAGWMDSAVARAWQDFSD